MFEQAYTEISKKLAIPKRSEDEELRASVRRFLEQTVYVIVAYLRGKTLWT